MASAASAGGKRSQGGVQILHRRFFREHFRVKGADTAEACARTIENLGRLKGLCA
jgi:hypothetical protein